MEQVIGHFENPDKAHSYYGIVKHLPSQSAAGTGGFYDYLLSLSGQECTGKTVLDIGGGNGAFSEIFHNSGASKVVLLDKSPAMLALAGERKMERSMHNLVLLEESYEEFIQDTRYEGFDILFSSFSLMYFLHVRNLLSRLCAKLAAGGRFHIFTNILTPKEEIPLWEQSRGIVVPIEVGYDSTIVLENLFQPVSCYIDGLEEGGLTIREIRYFTEALSRISPGYDNAYGFTLKLAAFSAVKPG